MYTDIELNGKICYIIKSNKYTIFEYTSDLVTPKFALKFTQSLL